MNGFGILMVYFVASLFAATVFGIVLVVVDFILKFFNRDWE